MKDLYEPLYERVWNQLKPIVSPEQRSQKIGIRLDQLCRNLEDVAQDEVLRGVLAQHSRIKTQLRFIQQIQILRLQCAKHCIAEVREHIR